MTPKEKAQELFEKYVNVEDTEWTIDNGCGMSTNEIKQCALICVDETLNQFIEIHNKFKGANLIKGDVKESANYIYWEEVKQEIKLL
jgi:hypothetical protein